MPGPWSTDSLWFDVAIITSLLAIGDVLFGHFEEHKAKWRRVVKLFVLTAVVAGFASAGLRWAGWAFIGAGMLGAAYLHIRWLPSHGINGWTGEPKEKLYALIDATRGKSPAVRPFLPSATGRTKPKV